MSGELGTTNLLLGIMAAVSVLEALAIIGMGVAGFFAYKRVTELVEGIAIAVGRRPHLVVMPPRITLWASDLISRYMRDVMLTRQELQGLMDELLVSHEKPRGTRRLDNFLLTYAYTLGKTYASELNRHWR